MATGGAPEVDLRQQSVLIRAMHEIARRSSRRKFFAMFPDDDFVAPTSAWPPGSVDGIYWSRHKYPKHMEFFGAGLHFRERAAIAGNRTGKTWGMGAYEVTCHLTGLYPPWWPGKVFTHPTRWWCAGKNNETTRDVVQAALLGEVTSSGATKFVSGTGMIPGDLIRPRSVKWKQGVADYVDTVRIEHASGRGASTIGFKSYEQGRGSFEGTAQHGIWFDEEPPMDVYGEALIRTATTDGMLMITFTPLEGLSEVVLQFMSADALSGGLRVSNK